MNPGVTCLLAACTTSAKLSNNDTPETVLTLVVPDQAVELRACITQ